MGANKYFGNKNPRTLKFKSTFKVTWDNVMLEVGALLPASEYLTCSWTPLRKHPRFRETVTCWLSLAIAKFFCVLIWNVPCWHPAPVLSSVRYHFRWWCYYFLLECLLSWGNFKAEEILQPREQIYLSFPNYLPGGMRSKLLVYHVYNEINLNPILIKTLTSIWYKMFCSV